MADLVPLWSLMFPGGWGYGHRDTEEHAYLHPLSARAHKIMRGTVATVPLLP